MATSSMYVQLCTAEVSSMVNFIKSDMASVMHSKWKNVITFQTMYAKEHVTCDKITGFYPFGKDAKDITFELPKINDLLESLYIQTTWPALDKQDDFFSCYVWALGYACWQSLEMKIAKVKIAHVPSVREEMFSELTSEPGQRLGEMVFKWEDVSWHNLERHSTNKSFTLFTPVKQLWFTQPGNELAFSGIRRSEIDVVLHMRPIQEFTASLRYTDSADGSKAPVLDANTDKQLPRVGGVDLDWSNEQVDINLLLGLVALPQEESELFVDLEAHYLVTNFQSTISESSEQGVPFPMNSDSLTIINHPFKYPTKGIVWAIADVNRASLQTDGPADDAELMKPWKGGVRSLFEERATLGSYHVLDDGCVLPDTFADGAKFTAGIKKYCAASGMGPWLPKNRYDYRMATKDGQEVEATKHFRLKFGGDPRIQEDLPGCYFRLIQQYEHFPRIARQGIYAYMFGDKWDPSVYSHGANLTQITNVEFTFVAGRKSEPGCELELLYWLPYSQVLRMNRGIIHEKYNG